MREVLERRSAKPSEENKSDFGIEYAQNVPDQVLIDDIKSYLGEYRFSLPEYPYDLDFADGQLIDPNRGESMEAGAQRAIDLKHHQGKSSAREQAEKTGFQKLDRQLKSAKTGDAILWMSPPGPESEGYGAYGFVFYGKVQGNGHEKKIRMIAKRVENPTIEQFNKAEEMLTGENKNHAKAEDFLKDPGVMQNLSEASVDSVLKEVFGFKPSKEEQNKFENIIRTMSPLISDFVRSLKDPWKTRSEKIRELYALENYALQLKKEYVIVDFNPTPRLRDIVGEYGREEPPKVAGSCPTGNNSDSEFTSSNIFSKGSFLNSLFGEQEWFKCPKCDFQADGPIGNTCPGCGLTKDAYAEKTGVSCE